MSEAPLCPTAGAMDPLAPRRRRPALRFHLLGVVLVVTLATAASAQEAGTDRTEVDYDPFVTVAAAMGLPSAPLSPLVVSYMPDATTLEANGAIIGEVTINNGEIFDPDKEGENNWLFRTANKLHINTRPRVIRSLLLFKPGDPYSAQKIAESERIIRESPYLYDADIRAVRYHDNKVDLVVDTRDVWTLSGGIGFGRTGGANDARLGLRDSNFLGTGKDITIQWSTNIDRTSMLYRFIDPNVGGSRVRMDLSYRDNSDGESWAVEGARPFYSLDTRWAVGGVALTDSRVETRWNLGEITDEFTQDETRYSMYGGTSKGLVKGRVGRWRFGYTYSESLFSPAPEGPENSIIPEDRILSYPWFSYERIEDQFLELHDFNLIHRTEDLNLGQTMRFNLGYSSEALGGNRDQFIFGSFYRNGLTPGRGQMMFVSAHGTGRFGPSGTENVVIGGQGQYYLRNLGRHLFFVGLEADIAYNLDLDNQLLLGGDTGLRGYPLRYQTGDRRVLLTVEQRFFTDWHLFKLLRVGGAVFADAGAAWYADANGNNPANLGLLRDVGLGLRLSSSRSSDGAMIHIDVAFPLDGTDDIDPVQFYITTKDTF
ncbi:MAG: hypothetical protein R3344_00410 [Acidobacteriota bacterium]|nr:hypothetical protein [Acidobacteriota bacterium]